MDDEVRSLFNDIDILVKAMCSLRLSELERACKESDVSVGEVLEVLTHYAEVEE